MTEYDEAKLIGCEDCGDETGRCSCGWIDGEEWLIEERGMAMAEDTSEDEDGPHCDVCGDIYCPSCGPAQGNSKCQVCGKWESDGGCDDVEHCAKLSAEIDEAMAKYEME